MLHKDAPATIYFVLAGTGGVREPLPEGGVRRFPNVKLVFDPTKGFNKGALRFVASTRSKQGVGQTELIMNYGLDFDVSREYPKTIEYQERFKGPLVRYMAHASASMLEVGAEDGSIGGGTKHEAPNPAGSEGEAQG